MSLVHSCLLCFDTFVVVGNYLYWHIKVELANPEFCERYALILEEYLAHAGPSSFLLQAVCFTFAWLSLTCACVSVGEFASRLRSQTEVVQRLQRLAEMVQHRKIDLKVCITAILLG